MSNLLFMDLETTGVHYDKNEVVEIACQFYQNGELKKTFHTHMNTSGTKDISLGALKVNRHVYGLHYEDREVAAINLVNFLVSLPSSKDTPISIAGHNVAFDVQMIKEFLKEFNIIGWGELFSYSVVDTSTIANTLRTAGILKMDRMSLGALARTLKLDVDSTKTHSAEYDTELSAKCYFKMIEILRDRELDANNYKALCSLEDETRHISKV